MTEDIKPSSVRYPSVDKLQNILAEQVFHYTKDAKKASGRALGTLVEIITFHFIKAWGLEQFTAIERCIPEYMNSGITHNVEFSLHPSEKLCVLNASQIKLPLSSKKILKNGGVLDQTANIKNVQLLSSNQLVKNACVIAEGPESFIVAHLSGTEKKREVEIFRYQPTPFAVVECKRVGVEEGMKKGPQTIEKAKQGAYVARCVSALQKVRLADGSLGGFLSNRNGEYKVGTYHEMLELAIKSEDIELLDGVVISVGVVSNHGNWFTSDNPNKELKVLAQSYDWLLFLTDLGLAEFIETLLISPKARYRAIKTSFEASYTGTKGKNQFTKSKMFLEADLALQAFFHENLADAEKWFNIISPSGRPLGEVKSELQILANKNWLGA